MATQFLEATGTSGFIATASAFGTTQLSALASGGAVTSTVVFTAGTGGTLSGAQKAQAWFTSAATFTPSTPGGGIACWFVESTDNGTTFEAVLSTPSATQMALPRPPDFYIPMELTAQGTGIKFAIGPFRLPYCAFKCIAQNLCGVTLGTGNHSITIGGVADQY